jgi:membrane protease YdiL (CAAX protease family)
MDRWWWGDLGFGLALGALLMTFIFLVEYIAGWIQVRETFAVGLADTPFAVAILGPLIVFVVVGITEEMLSRGYQLRNLSEGLNFPYWGPAGAIVAAWVISSSLFGLLHIFNPNATVISTLYLMLAGLFLGLGCVLTGRLGLPIGLHITWNFVQGNVYGFPVSGNIFTSATVIAIEQGGPSLWTGGAFGPEAGLIGIAAILLGCALTLLWVWLRYGAIRLYLPLACYRPLVKKP